ncbi:MAG TPA: VCBS repeat-containing protein, partial [Desulfuromonadales bacterium]|nr:VCBS repeat-containing protein [Desulfuromonadales bacterium]
VVGRATEDRVLARQLEMDLPQFDWLPENRSDEALVVFNLQPRRLDVKNAAGNLLRSYTVTDEQRLAVPSTSSRPSSVVRHEPKKKLMQRVADNLMETIGLDNDPDKAGPGSSELFIRQQDALQEGVWLGPNLSGQPVGIAVTDLDGDGRLETAVAMEDRLLIGRIEKGEYQQVAEVPFAVGLQMLSLDALDLDKNGQMELYLSAVKDYSPASLVIEFRNGSYQIVADGIRWFLRSVELPGQEGRWLVGQRMSETDPFAGNIFHVRREGDQLVPGGAVDLPDRLNIFNFVPLRGEQGQLLYVHLSAGDYLIVLSAEGQTLWESEDYFGGSELCFTHREEFRDEMLTPTCMRPRIIRTGDNQIVVAQNEGQRIMERYRKFSKSRVVALQWNGFALVEQWRSASQSGYLGDFTLADADNDGGRELVMAIKFKHAGLIDKARSAVVTYDLE